MNKFNQILNTPFYLKDVLLFFFFVFCGFTFYELFDQISQLNQTVIVLENTISNLNDTIKTLVATNNQMQEELILLKNTRATELENLPELLKEKNDMKKFWIKTIGISLLLIGAGGVVMYGSKVFSLKFFLPSSVYSFLQNNTFLIKDNIENYELLDKINGYVYKIVVKNKKPKIYTKDFDSIDFMDSDIFFKKKEEFMCQLLEKIKKLETPVNTDVIPFVENFSASNVENITNYAEVVEKVELLMNIFNA